MKSLCVVFLMLFFALPASAVSVPILMYHDFVSSDSPCGEYAVTDEEFRSHLCALRKNGYEAVTFAELIGYADGDNDLPEKPVIITADDGYDGVLDIAVPILREQGMKLSCAVIGAMAGENGHFPLCSVPADCVEIVSHTFDLHRDGVKLCGVLMASDDELRRDIALTREFCREHLMQKSVFVYPYGAYSADSERIFADEGYRVTVSCRRGIAEVTHGCELFALPRIGVWHGMDGSDLLRAISTDCDQH